MKENNTETMVLQIFFLLNIQKKKDVTKLKKIFAFSLRRHSSTFYTFLSVWSQTLSSRYWLFVSEDYFSVRKILPITILCQSTGTSP